MPGVPLEMPSETVIVLKTMLFAPAASAPSAASRASASMCMLHGVRLLHVEAIPTCGFEKSSSLKPTARSIARAGALGAPSTATRELSRGSTPGLGLGSSFAMQFRRLPGHLKGRDYGVPGLGGATGQASLTPFRRRFSGPKAARRHRRPASAFGGLDRESMIGRSPRHEEEWITGTPACSGSRASAAT